MINEYDTNYFIAEIANRKKVQRWKIVLIVREYCFIVTRELLKGNKVMFPFDFGSVEIINKKMTASELNNLKLRKKEIFDYFYTTEFLIEVPSLKEFALQMYMYGPVVERLLHILRNKLKSYRYVN